MSCIEQGLRWCDGCQVHHPQGQVWELWCPVSLDPLGSLSKSFACLSFHSLIQDVAQKTDEIVDDEMTTAMMLVCAIYSEGVKNITAGCNPMDLCHGSQVAIDHVIEFLSTNAKKVTMTAKIISLPCPLCLLPHSIHLQCQPCLLTTTMWRMCSMATMPISFPLSPLPVHPATSSAPPHPLATWRHQP